MRRFGWILGLVLVSGLSVASDAGTGPTALGQSCADALREATGADVALIASGFLNDGATDLRSALVYPTDGVAVVSLSGAQLQRALERSVSLLPNSNPGFLQVSGLAVTYRVSRPANGRVESVSVGGSALRADATYSVAMPLNLARGGLGYFLVWGENAPIRVVDDLTLERVMDGRSIVNSPARWTALP